jgi:hypothetical protein
MRAAVLVLALSGCSFVFSKPPPPASPQPATWPDCSTGYAPQIIDGLIAVFAVSGAVYLSQSTNRTDRTAGVAIESGIALGFGISALATIGRPAGCKRAKAAFDKDPNLHYGVPQTP